MGKNEKKKGFAKTVLGIVGVISLASVLGLGSVAYAAGVSLKEKVDVPTKYTVPDIASIAALPEKNATQRNYIIVDQDSALNYDKPDTNAISRDQAADIGAAEITKVFGLNLSGREIVMGYTAARGGNRAYWSGSIVISGDQKTEQGYSFDMNAITGEIHSVSYGRSIDAKVSLDFDSAVAKNPAVYESLAKKIAEEYGMVGGNVRSAAYTNQGYAFNDPDVTILVIGENGQHAQLRFSKYDQAFLGAMYNESMCQGSHRNVGFGSHRNVGFGSYNNVGFGFWVMKHAGFRSKV